MVSATFANVVLSVACALAPLGCSSSSTPAAPPPPADAGTDSAMPPSGGVVCLVADVGGLNDQSFNQTAFDGVKAAKAAYGWDWLASESQTATDYGPNLQHFVSLGTCNLIVAVGFNLSDATTAAATAAPAQKFQILDGVIDPPRANIWAQLYATDQGAFLAGYVAAGTSAHATVATFGGVQIPSVTSYMNGFALGVAYYNQQNSKSVQLLGWDVKTQTGRFTGDFVDQQAGKTLAQDLLSQGADVIFPVAGPVGLGAADAITTHGNAYLIGVDTDWTVSAPTYAGITLTSVVKKLDKSVLTAIGAIVNGTFKGGANTSVLASGEVDIAPFHALDSVVSDKVKSDLGPIRAGIIAGTIATTPTP
jgi:basic membrane protein A